LIQAYTLPYLKIIRKLRPEATIYLITEEKSGKLDGDSLLGIQASLASITLPLFLIGMPALDSEKSYDLP